MEVKCFWCKDKGEKEQMKSEEKGTGKYNKNGSEKVTRKYFHSNCYQLYKEDKVFKEKELQELDNLYQYLLSLHKLKVLDGRMIERIQDLRNGTVKVNNKKIKRYKSGVTYNEIFQTYKFVENKLMAVSNYKQLESGWNEFAYFLSIVINNINDVQDTIRRKSKEETIGRTVINKNISLQEEKKPLPNSQKKKDELDISSFL